MFKRFAKNIYAFGKDMSRHNSAAYASSIAFFFFMSLIPSMMFVFSLFRYLPLEESDINSLVAVFVPKAIMPAVESLVESIYDSTLTLVPVMAIATLWTANMGMLGLIRGLNGVLELKDKRNYFLLRGIATIYTLLMLSGIIISLLIMGFGRKLIRVIEKIIPDKDLRIIDLLGFRYIIIFILLTLVFTLAYTFLPAKNQNFILSLPGAAVAALGWLVVTWAFSIYIEYFNGFSIYGSLTLIMIMLFWIYACFTLLIVGAFLNKYYKEAIERNVVRIRVHRETKKEERKSSKDIKEINNV